MIMIPNGPDKRTITLISLSDLKALVAEGKVPPSRIDDAVRRILRIKFQLGLFDSTATDPAAYRRHRLAGTSRRRARVRARVARVAQK